VALCRIEAANSFLEVLFAGKVLIPVVQTGDLFLIMAGVLLFGILANMYPLKIAMQVPPVKAIQTE
jgi:ABC-type lipoprotein release transport system permease subunit